MPAPPAAVSAYARLVAPLLGALPAETAHGLALRALRHGLVPRPRRFEHPALGVSLWGLTFAHPIGLAAGFDKDALVAGPLLERGFAFVEVGSVTPRPQPGNPRPRLFRLSADQAIVNRMGFNSAGAAAVAARLAAPRRGIVGVNLGVNRDSADAVADYVAGARALGPHADYVVVNVSSPNTPGLRALQGTDRLAGLLEAVRAALGARPLLLKVAPDLSGEDRRAIAETALATGIDGIIATNTATRRPPGLRDRRAAEAGGLSGRPLMAPSTAVLSDLYAATGGRVALIGVGGVGDGRDAYAKVRAGATLVQLYSALVFHGPGLVGRIQRQLAALLEADGFAGLTEAVGADHR